MENPIIPIDAILSNVQQLKDIASKIQTEIKESETSNSKIYTLKVRIPNNLDNELREKILDEFFESPKRLKMKISIMLLKFLKNS